MAQVGIGTAYIQDSIVILGTTNVPGTINISTSSGEMTIASASKPVNKVCANVYNLTWFYEIQLSEKIGKTFDNACTDDFNKYKDALMEYRNSVSDSEVKEYTTAFNLCGLRFSSDARTGCVLTCDMISEAVIAFPLIMSPGDSGFSILKKNKQDEFLLNNQIPHGNNITITSSTNTSERRLPVRPLFNYNKVNYGLATGIPGGTSEATGAFYIYLSTEPKLILWYGTVGEMSFDSSVSVTSSSNTWYKTKKILCKPTFAVDPMNNYRVQGIIKVTPRDTTYLPEYVFVNRKVNFTNTSNPLASIKLFTVYNPGGLIPVPLP